MVTDQREWTMRLITAVIVVGLPLMVFGYQVVLRPALSDTRIIDIRMTVPETRGFSQDIIQASVGETITLHFSAGDVTHGIAIGPGLAVNLGAIDPGETAEVTLTFEQPGRYTYYCTTWCSPNHWRMRGIIEVRDPDRAEAIPVSQPDPVIANLQAEGVDIDLTRTLFEPLRGMRIAKLDSLDSWNVPSELTNVDWRRTHTPAEASELLSAANPDQPVQPVYAATASVWLNGQSNNTSDGEYLYNQNCAACHGQSGLSDGPGAFFTPVQPSSFGNVAYMFNMRSDVLYAKIQRGGMGTNMPNFGTIFTREETWALVEYLWHLAFASS